MLDVDINVHDTALNQLIAKLEKYRTTGLSIQPGGGGGIPGRLSPRPGGRGEETPEEKALPWAEKLSRQWGIMRDHTRDVVRNIREMAQRLMSISGILAGLTGLATLGGAFGFDKLAKDASNLRNQALGAGTTAGGLQGANIALGRFGNMSQLMSALKSGAQDKTSDAFKAMSALGMNPQASDDSFDLLQKFLPAARNAFIGQERRQPGSAGSFWEAIHGTGLLSLEQMRQLTGRPGQELTQQIGEANQLRGRLDVPDNTLRTFQDFMQKLQAAGATIEKTFVVDLAAVAKPLGDLSEAITKVLVSLIDSALKPDNVRAMADAIERFAKYMDTQFLTDFAAFTTKVGEAVTALEGFVTYIKNFFGSAKNTVTGTTNDTPASVEEQKGTPPAVTGWGRDADGRWRMFQGTDEGKQDPILPDLLPDRLKNDPLFRRKTPSALLHPSAYTQSSEGGGVPVFAARPLPVEIVGFRLGQRSNDEDKPPPANPYQGMVHDASFRTPIMGANDNSVLGLVRKYESGGRNVFNYRHADDPKGFTASGYYQMIDSTWREAKKLAGIPEDQFPRAIDAPYDVQTQAAQALLQNRGLQPWETNEPLMKALREMYFGGSGAGGEPMRSPPQAPASGPRRDFHPARPPSVGVTIQNETGGNFVTQSRLLAT
ncbi:MAG TPA: hypothetical protein VGM38_09275 [Pseudolysinimonas sp.]